VARDYEEGAQGAADEARARTAKGVLRARSRLV